MGITATASPRASELMSRNVIAIGPEVPVASIARLLADRGISAVPVTEPNGRLLGIVTEADLIRRVAAQEDRPAGWLARMFENPNRQAERFARTRGRTARDIMTTDVVSARAEDSAAHCAHLMEEHKVRRLPVLDEAGRLAGILSRADLLRALLAMPEPVGDTEAQEARIRDALDAEIRKQPWLDSFFSFADVEGRVVTLHGYVRSEEVRRGLRILAEQVPGVERVEDRLTIGTPTVPPLVG